MELNIPDFIVKIEKTKFNDGLLIGFVRGFKVKDIPESITMDNDTFHVRGYTGSTDSLMVEYRMKGEIE